MQTGPRNDDESPSEPDGLPSAGPGRAPDSAAEGESAGTLGGASTTAGAPPVHDPYAALRLPDYRRYLVGHVISILGMQMQTVAVGWEVWERTHSKLNLAWVGLVQFLPMLVMVLPAGQLLDRFDRRRMIMLALTIVASASAALGIISATRGPVWAMYVCLFLTGVARAMLQPAKASYLPQIIPRAQFSNAVTWNMSAFQLSAVVGPAIGGGLIGLLHRADVVFLLDSVAAVTFVVLLTRMKSPPRVAESRAVTLRSLVAGLEFVFQNKIILAAMTLDMFAVLLGGAVALLPVFADKDILNVGPTGLGWLQAAPAVGAIVMAWIIAHRPPIQRAGWTLLWAVAGFGVATVVFGLSRSFPLSLAMLLLTGAFDNISVVVRHTLVQLQTPDEMRGRVSAVNTMFISASNELGGAESGYVAYLFDRPGLPAWGPTVSVVAGGVGTLLVVGVTALLSGHLRRFGRLDGTQAK